MRRLHKSLLPYLKPVLTEVESFVEAAAGQPVFTRDGEADTIVIRNLRDDIVAVVFEPVCATVLFRDGGVRHTPSSDVFGG